MKVSVIIVSYNCKAFLDYCIQSVNKAIKNIKGEIIVIDNNSSDGTVELLESKKYNLNLIKSETNLGFSKASNKAAESAKGEYLFFLNPDTIIPEDIFVHFFRLNKPNLGIFGFRMIDGKGNFLKESKRNLPSITIIFKKLLGFDDKYYSTIDEHESGHVDVLCGANMIFQNSTFKKVDGFNEEYFMYGEDIEVCFQVKQIGNKNFYSSDSTIIHFKGESTINDIHYLRNFYGAMSIYFKNVFSTNRFLLALIIFFSKLLILIKSFSTERQRSDFKSKKNFLLGNKSVNKLNNLFGDITMVRKIDDSMNDCNIIFDSNYMTYKQIINYVNNTRGRKKINFCFLSHDYSYIIMAGGMKQKGNIIFL